MASSLFRLQAATPPHRSHFAALCLFSSLVSLVYNLQILAQVIEGGEIEQRLVQLEEGRARGQLP